MKPIHPSNRSRHGTQVRPPDQCAAATNRMHGGRTLAPRRFLIAVLWAGMSLLLPQSAWSQVLEVGTLAGRPGGAGYADAPGRSARFNQPSRVTVDPGGNLYVADTINNAIRKLAPDGTLSTLAGGQVGNADGLGTNASFRYPLGLALDGQGNLVVADSGNNTIRRVTPAGLVSTIAGRPGSYGSADGGGTNALFGHPSDLAVDAAGNIYVADTWNDTIRIITPAGVVQTVAGMGAKSYFVVGFTETLEYYTTGIGGSTDGVGTNALFFYPAGIALDASTNIYVADTGNQTIRKITPAGVVTTLAGRVTSSGAADGAGTNANFNTPEGIAVDLSGNLYVADSGNNTIRKVTPDGSVTTLAGRAGVTGGTDATGANSLFRRPLGVALDGGGNLWVADTGNNSIREVATNGLTVTFAGPGGSAGDQDGSGAAALFSYPRAVAVDGAANLYVADLLNSTIRKITPDGSVTTLAGQPGQTGSQNGIGTNASFASPAGLALDSLGNLYVSDSDNHVIRRVGPDGTVSTFAGRAGQSGSADGAGTNASFNGPLGLASDSLGNIYVADTGNDTIRVISPSGSVSTLAGKAGVAGFTNAIGTNALFSSPLAVGVDGEGNVYVADKGNEVVRVISSGGVVGVFAGSPGRAGSVDGTGTNASFSSMEGLAADAAGRVFVADSYSHTIRIISPEGVVTTVGGSPGTPGSTDGTGTNALFNHPSALAVTPGGSVYVADSLNNTIRQGTAGPPSLAINGAPGQVVLSWATWPPGVVLQSKPALVAAGGWTTQSNGFFQIGSQLVLTNAATEPAGFFRLAKP